MNQNVKNGLCDLFHDNPVNFEHAADYVAPPEPTRMPSAKSCTPERTKAPTVYDNGEQGKTIRSDEQCAI